MNVKEIFTYPLILVESKIHTFNFEFDIVY